jgi:hypothetical protein
VEIDGFREGYIRSGTRRLEPGVKGPIRVCLAFFRPKNSFAKLTVPDVGDVIWRVTAMRQG